MKVNSRHFPANCPNSEPSTMGQDRANDQRKPTTNTKRRGSTFDGGKLTRICDVTDI